MGLKPIGWRLESFPLCTSSMPDRKSILAIGQLAHYSHVTYAHIDYRGTPRSRTEHWFDGQVVEDQHLTWWHTPPALRIPVDRIEPCRFSLVRSRYHSMFQNKFI